MRDVEIAKLHGFIPVGFDGKPLPKGWPAPLHDAAFHGVAGEVVRAMAPHTRGRSRSALVQLLAGVGNMFPRGPYWQAGADKHHTNLFVVLVGASSTGRKGSSWNMIADLLRAVDANWREHHIQTGLSSGEGLIWQVRDPVVQRELDRKTGNSKEVEIDPGIKDKRLLTLEPEFASVLRSASRQGQHGFDLAAASLGWIQSRDDDKDPTDQVDNTAHQRRRPRLSGRASSRADTHRHRQWIREPVPLGRVAAIEVASRWR